MTRERANELKEVFNAYCEGKIIQWNDCGTWRDMTLFVPNNNVECRVKPTEQFRPYKDTDEMIRDWYDRRHEVLFDTIMPLIWVKNKEDKLKLSVISFSKDAVFTSEGWVDMQELFDDYEYLDGSKIGVKE